MDALVEFYDSQGRCFHKYRSRDEFTALTELAEQCKKWNGLGFSNASCYIHGREEWNLEIKG